MMFFRVRHFQTHELPTRAVEVLVYSDKGKRLNFRCQVPMIGLVYFHCIGIVMANKFGLSSGCCPQFQCPQRELRSHSLPVTITHNFVQAGQAFRQDVKNTFLRNYCAFRVHAASNLGSSCKMGGIWSRQPKVRSE